MHFMLFKKSHLEFGTPYIKQLSKKERRGLKYVNKAGAGALFEYLIENIFRPFRVTKRGVCMKYAAFYGDTLVKLRCKSYRVSLSRADSKFLKFLKETLRGNSAQRRCIYYNTFQIEESFSSWQKLAAPCTVRRSKSF